MAGRYEDAIKAYSTLLDDPASRAAAASGLATCLMETGDYDQAERTLLAAANESAHWHRTMATLLATIGRHAEGIGHYKKALGIDSQDRRSRFSLGVLYELTGQRKKAVVTYEPLVSPAADESPPSAAALTAMAGGLIRYSVLTRHEQLAERTQFALRDLLQRAYERIDRTYWPARVAGADLLASKHRYEEAAQDYEAALRINPNLAVAHVGLGRIALDQWDFEAAQEKIALARECNPNDPAMWRLKAALAMTERRYEDARAAANEALTVNPNNAESLGLLAAAHYCLNDSDGVSSSRRRAYQCSPTPAAFHRVLADTLGALRQYKESESEYRKATQFDPTAPEILTELGMMYMQWGEETKAHQALTEAWELDRFDSRTLNTMRLLESLERFARYETENFVIRYDESRDGAAVPYIADYLEEIHEELCEDFSWTPSEKTIIELFPTHRMFGVRITGKPWIHTVGACTGKVIAMESPRDHPQSHGLYHLAHVLRHEYTHTVTLAVTGNRIPHWFTEGLAVLQEDSDTPLAWCEILAHAARTGGLFSMDVIDWAFVRPRGPNDRQQAYAQSEWMCEFIIERYGYDVIETMLDEFRRRNKQSAVFDKVIGVTLDQFHAAFIEWARRQAESWGFDMTPPEDPAVIAKLAVADPQNIELQERWARAELDAGGLEEAIYVSRRVIDLSPDSREALTVIGLALWQVRRLSEDADTTRLIDAQLLPAMTSLLAIDDHGWIAPKVLGTVALENGDHENAIVLLRRLKKARPIDPDADRGLAAAFLAQGDYARAIIHLSALARVEDSDPDVALTLAALLERQGKAGEARYWYLQSIYLDPFRTDSHRALAATCVGLGDTSCAIRAYKALCSLEPDNVQHYEDIARAYESLGDMDSAIRYAEKAVKIEPLSKVRSMLENRP